MKLSLPPLLRIRVSLPGQRHFTTSPHRQAQNRIYDTSYVPGQHAAPPPFAESSKIYLTLLRIKQDPQPLRLPDRTPRQRRKPSCPHYILVSELVPVMQSHRATDKRGRRADGPIAGWRW